MAVAKTGIKPRKKQRKCMRYRFTDSDWNVTFLDVGAFSSKQSWAIAYKAMRALSNNAIQTDKTDRWPIKKPDNAPEKGCFVLDKDGNLLKID